jgi:hypothetical protein
VRLEGLGQLENSMTASGIEHVTYRFVVKCLNQLRYGMAVITRVCCTVNLAVLNRMRIGFGRVRCDKDCKVCTYGL